LLQKIHSSLSVGHYILEHIGGWPEIYIGTEQKKGYQRVCEILWIVILAKDKKDKAISPRLYCSLWIYHSKYSPMWWTPRLPSWSKIKHSYELWCIYGCILPQSILSNRNLLFLSNFWQRFLNSKCIIKCFLLTIHNKWPNRSG
jgi:hypothetical protein